MKRLFHLNFVLFSFTICFVPAADLLTQCFFHIFFRPRSNVCSTLSGRHGFFVALAKFLVDVAINVIVVMMLMC